MGENHTISVFLLGMWQWVDKAPLDYTNWGDDLSMNTGAINSADGQWTADSERYSKPYVCKVPKSEYRCYSHRSTYL